MLKPITEEILLAVAMFDQTRNWVDYEHFTSMKLLQISKKSDEYVLNSSLPFDGEYWLPVKNLFHTDTHSLIGSDVQRVNSFYTYENITTRPELPIVAYMEVTSDRFFIYSFDSNGISGANVP